MLLKEALARYRLILASASPRRNELLSQMGLSFEVHPLAVKETFPDQLTGSAISDYLAKLKADAFINKLQANDLLITADTIVWHDNRLLGKPAHASEALSMLRSLSGNWHEVITSVCVTGKQKQLLAHERTQVKFRHLNEEEMRYYIAAFTPLDKAGAYGIQEWIGLVGIEEIKGSYPNVVGLPTHKVYDLLRAMVP